MTQNYTDTFFSYFDLQDFLYLPASSEIYKQKYANRMKGPLSHIRNYVRTRFDYGSGCEPASKASRVKQHSLELWKEEK